MVIPYRPRLHWQGAEGLHARLDSHRFSVIVAHRRFGKTLGVINHILRRALMFDGQAGRYGYVAPYRAQAKSIAWDYLKRYALCVPGAAAREVDLAVVLPNGATVRLFGADNPDALRGLYFDGLIMDEVSDMKPEVWGEVLRPALSDRRGWCVFIGTPRGQDLLFEKYNEALKNPLWHAALFRADETGVLPPEELRALREELSDNQYRQEFLCDFTAASDDCLIALDTVLAAQKRVYKDDALRGAPLVLGYDVARFGDDEAVLTARRGLMCYPQRRFKGLDIVSQAGILAGEIERLRPEAVFIDAGAMGAGVIDNLRALGHGVVEVNFGASSGDPRYLNKRAQMWGLLAGWLKEGAIPKDARLAQELTLTRYSFDPAGRLRLEDKAKLKARLGASPDGADSLALTFAFPVGGLRGRCDKAAYDPLALM